ncbi:hypothetical protein KW798_03050 [Candidatus Parcubacteria bacterium]|nr:hypothetical protein [Candidatus Parcubacteria bacterium]
MTISKFAVGTLGAVVFALALVFAVAPTTHAQEFDGFDGYSDCSDCGYDYSYDSGFDGFDGVDSCDWDCGSGYDGYTGSDCNDFGCGGGYGGGSYGGGSWGGGVYVAPTHTTTVTPSVNNVNNNYNTNNNQNVNNVNVTVGSTDNDNNDDHNDHNYSNHNRHISYNPPVVYNPPVYTPYVTLSQVPYTGLELGFWGTVAYWGFLVLWCLLAAYLIAVKKVHTRWANRIKVFLFGDDSIVSHPAYMQVETPVFAAASAAVAPQIATLGEVHTHNASTAVANDSEEDTTDPFILSQINRYN